MEEALAAHVSEATNNPRQSKFPCTYQISVVQFQCVLTTWASPSSPFKASVWGCVFAAQVSQGVQSASECQQAHVDYLQKSLCGLSSGMSEYSEATALAFQGTTATADAMRLKVCCVFIH